MALAISSLASSFSSLSLSSSFANPHPKTLISFAHRRGPNPRLFFTRNSDTSTAEAADEDDDDEEEEEEEEEQVQYLDYENDPEYIEWKARKDARLTTLRYVKSRLPGGIAAQRIIGTGKRKTAIARVALQEGTGQVYINFREAKDYLQGNAEWLEYCKAPLMLLGFENSYDVIVKVKGGGLSGQAQAISYGVAKALLKLSENYRKTLRVAGLMTRDCRIVERKKAGFKKARKRPQYSKR